MYIGDLHIHSRYSRATSRDCTPEYLDLWARKKGIHPSCMEGRIEGEAGAGRRWLIYVEG